MMGHWIIDRETYEKIYKPGLIKLHSSLMEWNAKANALEPPYQDEIDRLEQMFNWFGEEFGSGKPHVRDNFSVKTERLLRAGALLSIYLKERDITEGRARLYPQRVTKSMESDLSWMCKRADLMKEVEPDDSLWTVIPKPQTKTDSPQQDSVEPQTIWDVFISHATEDKEPFVRQLAEALQHSGLNIWYDQFTLKVGDSLRRSIDKGLAKSKFGVVVLSPYFFGKEWPQRELDGLVAKEIGGRKVILPVWHNIDADEIRKFSLPLADLVAAKSSDGLDRVVAELLRAIAG